MLDSVISSIFKTVLCTTASGSSPPMATGIQMMGTGGTTFYAQSDLRFFRSQDASMQAARADFHERLKEIKRRNGERDPLGLLQPKVFKRLPGQFGSRKLMCPIKKREPKKLHPQQALRKSVRVKPPKRGPQKRSGRR